MEFQKKAIGKMKDISAGGGRTVLFVSHNMVSIQALCSRAILMENGGVKYDGNVNEVIDEYMKLNAEAQKSRFFYEDPDLAPGNEHIRILSFSINPEEPFIHEEVALVFKVLNTSKYDGLSISIDFVNNQEIIAFGTGVDFKCAKGEAKSVKCHIPKDLLNDGLFNLNVYVSSDTKSLLFAHNNLVSFEVREDKRELGYLGKVNGVVRPKLNWEII
jgi:lipopolysaccharide transport system ATP-binding protein